LCLFNLTVVYVVERRNFAESLSSGPGRGTKRFLQHDAYHNNPVPHKIPKNHRISSEGISHRSTAKTTFAFFLHRFGTFSKTLLTFSKL